MGDYLKIILLMMFAGTPILAGTTNTRSTSTASEAVIKTYGKLVKRMTYELERRGGEFNRAAREGNLDTIKDFIAVGFDVNYYDGIPMYAAAEGGHLEIVKTLLEAGANPDGSDKIGSRGLPLKAAAGNNNLEMINLLLEAGASVNFTKAEILERAAKNGHVEAIQRLLEAGADPSPIYGNTLYFAVDNGHLDVVNALIAGGAKVNSYSGITVNSAAKQGLVEIMKALIKAGLNPNRFEMAMITAAYNGQLDIVKLMLENGADPNIGDALRTAVRYGDVEVVRVLLDAGSNITYEEDNGYPLHYAVMEGHSEVTELLVEYGGDINRALEGDYFRKYSANSYGNGWTVMHIAARWGQPMIQKLLELGADINIQDARGYTPIQIAIKSKKLFVAEEMLKYCADLSPINEEGETALDMVKNVTSKNVMSPNATSANATSQNATSQNTTSQIATKEPTKQEILMGVLTKAMPEKISSSPDDRTTMKAIGIEFEEMIEVDSTLKDQINDLYRGYLSFQYMHKVNDAIKSLFEERFLRNIAKIFEDHKCAVALYDQDTVAIATVDVGKVYMAKCKCIPGQGPKMSFAPIV